MSLRKRAALRKGHKGEARLLGLQLGVEKLLRLPRGSLMIVRMCADETGNSRERLFEIVGSVSRDGVIHCTWWVLPARTSR